MKIRTDFPRNRMFPLILAALAYLPVSQAEAPAAIKQEWQPSTLSEQAQAQVNAGVQQYQACLNDETRIHVNDKDDSRRVTDLILRNCEKKLTAVKEALDAEKVPRGLSDRYLRSKRSLGAQQVVRVVMGAQAARHAEQQP